MDKYRKPLNAIRGGLIWLSGLFGIGLLFLAWVLHDSGIKERELASRLMQLPDVHLAQPGETAVVAGTIADSTPLLREEFVAFRREQRKSEFRGSRDVVIETGKQPLDIRTSVGRVRIVNDDYAFDERSIYWAAEERVEPPAGALEGAITIMGFVHDSEIVAIGTVEQESGAIGEPVSVRAETLVAGPLDRLVAQLQRGSSRLRTAIPYVLGGAVLLLLYAFWEGRRLYRD